MRVNFLTISAMLCALMLAFFSSCKDMPPGPVDGNTGPRNYTWTVDTLRYPGSFQTSMRDIWASSPTDVYTVGFNDQGIGNMYHYDGKAWKPVPLGTSVGGQIEGFTEVSSVYGFSSSNIWAVGRSLDENPKPPPNFLDSSLIIHYDGAQWRELPIQRGRKLSAVWGANLTSIWAVGYVGTAFYYNGVSWERRKIRDDINFTRVTGSSLSDVYVLGFKLDTQPYDSIASYIFHFDGTNWTLQDSLIENTFPPRHTFGISRIWALNSSEVFTTGYGIFKKSGIGWTKVYDDGNLFGGIHGNASNNIFTVGSAGIYHYNGSDWYRYPQFTNLSFPVINVWADSKEVFAVGTDGFTTFILHGK